MYIGHDYTHDEFGTGSRSIFTELHDFEIPVPFEQTGNMHFVLTSLPSSSLSSVPSTNPPISGN